jgi:hypothetical protein
VASKCYINPFTLSRTVQAKFCIFSKGEMAFITSLRILLLSVLFKISESYISSNVVDFGADPKANTESSSAFLARMGESMYLFSTRRVCIPAGTFLLHLTRSTGSKDSFGGSEKRQGHSFVRPEKRDPAGLLTDSFPARLLHNPP